MTNPYWEIGFVRSGQDEGRYRRPRYEVKVSGCDLVGMIEWAGSYGWHLRVTSQYMPYLNAANMTTIIAFMESLPIYEEGRAISGAPQ